MAERKKGKKRKEEFASRTEEVDKPTKEEFAVAKWLRKNVEQKNTKFLNHSVCYFTARKAVDALLVSKWVEGEQALFKTREEIVNYLHVMLEHKFFHRARKVPVTDAELKGKKKEKKATSGSEDVEKVKEKEERKTDAESSVVETKDKDQKSEKSKRKKKIRLEMHNDQVFVDGLDAYVWIYDPIPFYYWIFGTLLVLACVGVCMFPLWPPSVRLGVYYLSLVAAGFLVAILLLVIIRLILFCVIWAVSLGKHHLWILPNLTEDVGFFASFWPLYAYEYRGKDFLPKKEKGKKKKKDKDSDAEQEPDDDKKDTVEEKPQQSSFEEVEKNNEEVGGVQVETLAPSETESESSQRSSTGKDFEIVDQDELES